MRQALSLFTLALTATQAFAFEQAQANTNAVFDCTKTAFKRAQRTLDCKRTDLPDIFSAIDTSCGEHEKPGAVRLVNTICGVWNTQESGVKERAFAPPVLATSSTTAGTTPAPHLSSGVTSSDPQPTGCTCGKAETTTTASTLHIGLGHGPVVLSSSTAAPSSRVEGGRIHLTSTSIATATLTLGTTSPSHTNSPNQLMGTDVSAEINDNPSASPSTFSHFKGAASSPVLRSVLATGAFTAVVAIMAMAL